MKDLSFYSDYYIDLSCDLPPLKLHSIFNNSNETTLEIGFGEGDFLTQLAKHHPNKNFLGLEIKKTRFRKALSSAKKYSLNNIRFMHFDASIDLMQVFRKNSFSNVYINFPDPWPKQRHHKHRIIKPELLFQLHKATTDGCFINIASDHKEYIKIIIEDFGDNGLFKLSSTLRYFGTHSAPQKTITKFERQFIRERREIYYLSYIKRTKSNFGERK